MADKTEVTVTEDKVHGSLVTITITPSPGVSEETIREKAAEVGIPIHRDPPTARAIHAAVAVGAPIRPEHFKAVAAAIRFAEAMRKKAKEYRK